MTILDDVEVDSTRLLDLWRGQKEYGEPIGCLASTYTFDSEFFEQDCLSRFLAIEADPTEDDREFILEREEKLAGIYAGVLVDRQHVCSRNSLRWDLLPVQLPSGIQHSKVTLLAWHNVVRLIVSSANITRPGYRSNLEFAGGLDFSDGGEIPLSLLNDVLAFLRRLIARMPTSSPGDGGPRKSAEDFLARVTSIVRRWNTSAWRPGQPAVHFVTVEPGRASLPDQLGALWSGTGADLCQITSPFYDKEGRSSELVDRVRAIMGRYGGRELQVVAAGSENEDGSITLALPEAIVDAVRPDEILRVFMREPRFNGESRPLHGKGLWLERGQRALHCVGSSNFTHPAYGVGDWINVEANLAYVIPNIASEFGSGCAALDDGAIEIDLDEQEVHFLEPASSKTPDGDAYSPLPVEFGEALFDSDGHRQWLALFIAPWFEPAFTISLFDNDQAVLSSAALPASDIEGMYRADLHSIYPPSALKVLIEEPGAPPRVCIWPVNARSYEFIPEPEELRALSVDDLYAALSSKRPLARLVKGKTIRAEAGASAIVFDSHAKVDTRNHLIRRMRRHSRALVGLTERLSTTAYTEQGLRRRFSGPIGAITLARAILREEQGNVLGLDGIIPQSGAAFMIAEIVQAVRSADYRASEALIGRAPVRAIVNESILELQRLASEAPAPENLRNYVDKVFSEVQ